MKEFAITILVVIIVTLPHLINWMWRHTTSNDNPPFGQMYIGASIFLTFMYAIITGVCLHYIVKWGKDYFKK